MWERLSKTWRACLAQAWRAYGATSGCVGAAVTDAAGEVIASAAGHIVAEGRVRILDERGAPRAVHPLAHAELLALLSFSRGDAEPQTCALYTTVEPCPLCFGALIMSNVREVHYACRDPWAGSVNLLETTPYMKRHVGKVRIYGPEDEELEDAVAALTITQMLERGQAEVIVAAWREKIPRGAAVAGDLSRAGRLAELAAAAASPEDVFRELADRVRASRPPRAS